MTKKLLYKLVPASVRLARYPIIYYLTVFRNFFVVNNKISDFKNIPIIINNYNRVTTLRNLVNCLRKRGYYNIYIIDNKSTYPPLLEYYKDCPCHIFYLEKNIGYRAFSETGIYRQFRNMFFVYTDSDIFIPDNCPDDFIEYFYNILVKTPYCSKVGNALKIDDIPDCYLQKKKVIEYESQYWIKKIGPNMFQAPIDTTFALYKPNFTVGFSFSGHNIRVAGEYTSIHMPWYVDSNNLDEEESFYIQSAKQSTFWTQLNKK